MKKSFLVFLFFILGASFVCYFKLMENPFSKCNALEVTDKPIDKVNDTLKEENQIDEDISMPVNTNHYKESETMTFNEYLYSDKKTGVLELNKNGDAIFNGKVIITNRNTPINDETAYTDEELKILFYAKGLEPKEGCDPSDTEKNGALGCFIDDPDED